MPVKQTTVALQGLLGFATAATTRHSFQPGAAKIALTQRMLDEIATLSAEPNQWVDFMVL